VESEMRLQQRPDARGEGNHSHLCSLAIWAALASESEAAYLPVNVVTAEVWRSTTSSRCEASHEEWQANGPWMGSPTCDLGFSESRRAVAFQDILERKPGIDVAKSRQLRRSQGSRHLFHRSRSLPGDERGTPHGCQRKTYLCCCWESYIPVKLHAGRNFAASRYCDTRSSHEVVRLILRLNHPCHWVSLGT
jgi:hypothetical protein